MSIEIIVYRFAYRKAKNLLSLAPFSIIFLADFSITIYTVADFPHYWPNFSHYVRRLINFVSAQLINGMAKKQLNRIKAVLADKNKTGIWLAQQLGKDRTTVSKWCSNAVQPSLETVIEVAQCLDVGIEELIRMPEKNEGGE